jgi:hypothetical protein
MFATKQQVLPLVYIPDWLMKSSVFSGQRGDCACRFLLPKAKSLARAKYCGLYGMGWTWTQVEDWAVCTYACICGGNHDGAVGCRS